MAIHLLSLTLFTALSGCDAITMDAMPSEAEISARYPLFLVDADRLAGIYANRDLDAALFSYVSRETAVLGTLAARLSKASWQVSSATPSQLVVFRNMNGAQGELGLFSLEVAKVGLVGAKVCVGYLQMDSATRMDISTPTAENRWAEKYFWPRYEACKDP